MSNNDESIIIMTAYHPQHTSLCGWQEGQTAVLDEWKYGKIGSGAPCVTTTGTWMMLTWCAPSSAVVTPSMWRARPAYFPRGKDPSTWTIWTVRAKRRTCGAARLHRRRIKTVDTKRTLVWCAQVEFKKVYSYTQKSENLLWKLNVINKLTLSIKVNS